MLQGQQKMSLFITKLFLTVLMMFSSFPLFRSSVFAFCAMLSGLVSALIFLLYWNATEIDVYNEEGVRDMIGCVEKNQWRIHGNWDFDE